MPLSIEQCKSLLDGYLEKVVNLYKKAEVYDRTQNTANIELVAKWLSAETNNTKPSLMLNGAVGRGKSTIAIAIKEMVASMKSANEQYLIRNRYKLPPEQIRYYEQWSRVHNIEYISAYEAVADDMSFAKACNTPVLIIDDFGVEPLTVKTYGTTCTPIIEIIYKRYNKRMPTIFTTNLSPAKISERYGERVWDRMKEWCNFIDFKGESLRK